MRLACVQLLDDYADDADITLSTYRARPTMINPPQGFVDSMGEVQDHSTRLTRRLPTADVVLLHGLYDSGSAVDQRDAFMDGFSTWVDDRFHAAGPNSTIGLAGFEDIPLYVPEWINSDKAYYATRLTLVGYGLREP